ncbi:hypothetical protein ABK040_006927 [Willaertia magna]
MGNKSARFLSVRSKYLKAKTKIPPKDLIRGSNYLAGNVPKDILTEICSYLTLFDIVQYIAPLSKEIFTNFFLNPTSYHWKILNLSDSPLVNDKFIYRLYKWNVLQFTKAIILRRTAIHNSTVTKFMESLKSGGLPSLEFLDIRSCYLVSYRTRNALKALKPNVVIADEATDDDILESTKEFYNMIKGYNISKKDFRLIGYSISACDCNFCCEYNLKMKIGLNIVPGCVDAAAYNFNFEYLEKHNLENSDINPNVCIPICCTSPHFKASLEELKFIIGKLRIARRLVPLLGSELRAACSKSIMTHYAGSNYSLIEILVDDSGSFVHLADNRYGFGLIANCNIFGFIVTSYDKYMGFKQCIKCCRSLSKLLESDMEQVLALQCIP